MPHWPQTSLGTFWFLKTFVTREEGGGNGTGLPVSGQRLPSAWWDSGCGGLRPQQGPSKEAAMGTGD